VAGRFDDQAGYGRRKRFEISKPFNRFLTANASKTDVSGRQRLCVDGVFKEPIIMSFRVCAILLCLVGVSACGSNTSPSSTPAPAPTGSTTVTIVSGASTLSTTAYTPPSPTVAVGTTVSWLNSDNVTHTSVSNNGLSFNSGNIEPNARFNFTFTSAGTFPYHCAIHPNMVGTITVQ
jgi:plastocyanin